jgi:hypothetical protein
MINKEEGFLADIKKGLDADRDADYGVTAAEAEKLMARYPQDTPAAYTKIKPEEFFDGV